MSLWLGDVKKEGGIFLVCPDAGVGGWGRSRQGFGNVLGPLLDAIRRYPVDLNRIFIDGASMGGNGSFQFPTYFPDMFAGAMPRAGATESGCSSGTTPLPMGELRKGSWVVSMKARISSSACE